MTSLSPAAEQPPARVVVIPPTVPASIYSWGDDVRDLARDVAQSYQRVKRRHGGLLQLTAWFLLQWAHRLTVVAMLAMLGVFALIFMQKGYGAAVTVGAGCGDAALCAAVFARVVFRKKMPAVAREALGVAVMSGTIFGLSVFLMVFERVPLLREMASDFFTPAPLAQPAAHNE